MKNLSAIFTVAAQLAIPLYAGAATPDPQQDEDYATELQRKVDQGDGDAALQIGNLLVRSRIPGPRYGTPITWFKKGCTLRSLPACHNVGVSYQQIAGPQSAASQNVMHIRELTEQLQVTVAALEQASAMAEARHRCVILLCVIATALSAVALCVTLFSALLQ